MAICVRAQPRQNGDGTFGTDIARRRQLGGHLIDQLAGGTRVQGDRARVQRHVAALNSLGRERAQCSEIGSEAYRGHHHPEIACACNVEDAECEARAGVDAVKAYEVVYAALGLDAAYEQRIIARHRG